MFERFTDRARTVLVEAQHEAVETGLEFIDTEHLLIGMLREGHGVAAVALNDHGVALEAVREKVAAVHGQDGGDRAAALATLGIDLDAVRSAVEAAFGEGALSDLSTDFVGSAGTLRRPKLTPRTKKALQLALGEMRQLGHSYIGTEHLLLGLLGEGTGMAAQVLVHLGVDLGALRQRVYELIDVISSGQITQGADFLQRRSRILDRGSTVICSFCGRQGTDSVRVIVGQRGAFICENCLYAWTAALGSSGLGGETREVDQAGPGSDGDDGEGSHASSAPDT